MNAKLPNPYYQTQDYGSGLRRSPNTQRSTICGALRGLEAWQPTCDLAAGHAGAHHWGGPSLSGFTWPEVLS